MGSFSMMHWLVLLFIVLILFGAGKIPRVMGDFAKGIKAFKAGMRDDEEDAQMGEKPRVTTGETGGSAGVHVGAEARPGERG